MAHLPANVKSSHHYFIEEELREELLKRNEALLNPIGLVGKKQSFSLPVNLHVVVDGELYFLVAW